MATSSHTGRLLLTPADPRFSPDLHALASALRDCGFIGQPLAEGETAFLAGDHLLQWISFTGCSPQIRLEPPAGATGSFCHVRFAGPYPAPRLLWGRNTRPPRCPSCRGPIRDWQGHRAGWEASAETPFPCPECHRTLTPLDLGWRDNGGFGRCFVSVEDVFPGEAAPVPALYGLLAHASGKPWRTFYIQD